MRRASLFAATLFAASAALNPAPVVAQSGGGFATASAADRFKTETFEFANRNGQKLLLDRIVDTSLPQSGRRPVLIWSFGGGWEGGERNDAMATDFLRYFAARGYTAIAIDYRLAVKEAKAKGEYKAETLLPLYHKAIQWGVEDLFDATAFVLKHADEWNIDKEQIVTIGSSAGATNSLVAEYNRANQTELARARLPADFRYAGVVAMAGAFWLPGESPLTFKTQPAPFMFFHGSKDQLVTYDEGEDKRGVAAYGPVSFQRRFPTPDYPSWFVDLPEADHVVSVAPMIDYRLEIEAFLDKMVRQKQHAVIHTVEKDKVTKNFGNIMPLYGKFFQALQQPAKP